MNKFFKLSLILLLCFSVKAKAQPCSGYPKVFVSVGGSSPYTLTANTGTATGFTYQWDYSPSSMGPYSALVGGSSSTYTLPSFTISGYYRVQVTCTSTASSVYSCEVYVPTGTLSSCATPTISPSKSAICPSDTITINSTVSGSCNLYQWQDSLLGDISGATASTLKLIPPISTTKTYRLKFTCAYGITYSSWLRVAPITTCDTAMVSISKTIGCTGDTVKLKGTGISPCATVQWEDSLTGAIAGATIDSINIIGATTRKSYRLKSTCPLGKISYSDWVSYTPYPCDSPIVAASTIGGCAGDTLTLIASGISPCTRLQWEDSLSGTVMPVADSLIKIVTGTSRNAFRLKATCPSGKIYYSDWKSFTPYTTCYDSVWAGDVNWDLIVDYLDLLDLGVAYGSTGFARTSPTITWVAQYSKNWPKFYPSTVNYKNADCDGNGVVNDDDTLAIYTNYSLIHSIGVIVPKHTKITGVPDLYFDLSGLAPKAGDVISVPIKLGTASVPVPLIYGIATQIYIDGVPAITAPINIDFSSTWIGTPKYKLDMFSSPSSNQINSTYVRKDNNNTTGYGTIGMLTFQVPPSTNDKSMMRLNFLSAKMIDKLGNELTDYNIINDSIMVLASTSIKAQHNDNFKLYVYPNPSNGKITITESINKFKNAELKIYDLLGREVHHLTIEFINNSASITLDISKGTYILELKDEVGNVQRERIVIN